MLSSIGYPSLPLGRTNSNAGAIRYAEGRNYSGGSFSRSSAPPIYNAPPSSSTAAPRSSLNGLFSIYRRHDDRDRSTSPTPRSRYEAPDSISRGTSNRGGTYPTLNESSSFYQNYQSRQGRSRSYKIVPAAMKDAFVYEASVESRSNMFNTPESELSDLSDASDSSMGSLMDTTEASFLPQSSSGRAPVYTEPESMYSSDPALPQRTASSDMRTSYLPQNSLPRVPSPPQPVYEHPRYSRPAPPSPVVVPPPPPVALSSRSSNSSSSSASQSKSQNRRPSISLTIPSIPSIPETRAFDNNVVLPPPPPPSMSDARLDHPVTVVRSDRPHVDRANSAPLPPRPMPERPPGARRESEPVLSVHQNIAIGRDEIRVQEAAPVRSVRWNEELICPSPILPSQRRRGWFNRRGDQLWTNIGDYRPAPPDDLYPRDLVDYPEYGQGWMSEDGTRIDMEHRLIPKPPLRSALKQRPTRFDDNNTNNIINIEPVMYAAAPGSGTRSE